MSVEIVISIITLIGVIISSVSTILTVSSKLAINQAITDEKVKSINDTLKDVVVNCKDIPVMKHQIYQLEVRMDKMEEVK